jgi:hypothetical protein
MGGCRRGLLRSHLFSLLLLLGTGPSLSADEPAGDWPLFRGNPQQTGVASSNLPEQLAVCGTFKAGAGIDATPAVAGGVVYVGTENGQLYALDLAAGQQKWQHKVGPLRGAPSVHGDAGYVGDGSGTFHCLDTASGKPRWTFERQVKQFGYLTTPASQQLPKLFHPPHQAAGVVRKASANRSKSHAAADGSTAAAHSPSGAMAR